MPYDDSDRIGSWKLLSKHARQEAGSWVTHADGAEYGRKVEALLCLPGGCDENSGIDPSHSCSLSKDSVLLMICNTTRRPRPILYELAIRGVSTRWKLLLNGDNLEGPNEELVPPAPSKWLKRNQLNFLPIVAGMTCTSSHTSDRVTVSSFVLDDEPTEKTAFERIKRRRPAAIRGGDDPLVLEVSCKVDE